MFVVVVDDNLLMVILKQEDDDAQTIDNGSWYSFVSAGDAVSFDASKRWSRSRAFSFQQRFHFFYKSSSVFAGRMDRLC